MDDLVCRLRRYYRAFEVTGENTSMLARMVKEAADALEEKEEKTYEQLLDDAMKSVQEARDMFVQFYDDFDFDWCVDQFDGVQTGLERLRWLKKNCGERLNPQDMAKDE